MYVLSNNLSGACHAYAGMFLCMRECIIPMDEATRRSKPTNRTYAKSVPKYLQLQAIRGRSARRSTLAAKNWAPKYLLLHQENYVM
jgi:hypothetical protein